MGWPYAPAGKGVPDGEGLVLPATSTYRRWRSAMGFVCRVHVGEVLTAATFNDTDCPLHQDGTPADHKHVEGQVISPGIGQQKLACIPEMTANKKGETTAAYTVRAQNRCQADYSSYRAKAVELGLDVASLPPSVEKGCFIFKNKLSQRDHAANEGKRLEVFEKIKVETAKKSKLFVGQCLIRSLIL